MNRWATFIRPLRGLGRNTFCAKLKRRAGHQENFRKRVLPLQGAVIYLLETGGLRFASTTGYYLAAFQAATLRHLSRAQSFFLSGGPIRSLSAR